MEALPTLAERFHNFFVTLDDDEFLKFLKDEITSFRDARTDYPWARRRREDQGQAREVIPSVSPGNFLLNDRFFSP
jgi:hypothetical protein